MSDMPTNARSRPSPPARAGMAAIRGYQKVMAGSAPRCRFAPSCSEYTREAIERFGLVRGVAKGARRVSRCHPWNPGGYDPVIDSNTSSASGG
jgi:putative membrane protein insertion efficiency factor